MKEQKMRITETEARRRKLTTNVKLKMARTLMQYQKITAEQAANAVGLGKAEYAALKGAAE